MLLAAQLHLKQPPATENMCHSVKPKLKRCLMQMYTMALLNMTEVLVVFLIPGKCHDRTLKQATVLHC
jgi:hypothetical protein